MNQPTHQHPRLSSLRASPRSEEDPMNDSFPAESYEQIRVSQAPSAQQDTPARKLILTLEGEVLREYNINSRNMSVGRKHGNDIQLNDLTLSGRHAMLSCIPDYVFIEDLGSTNGTMVNGKHIKKVALEHGDIIQIGNHQLTYLCEEGVNYEPTMFIKAELDETQIIYTDAQTQENIVKGLRLGGLRTLGNSTIARPVMELRKTYNTIGFQGKRMAMITRGTKGYSITAVTSTRSRRAADAPLLNGGRLTNEQYMLQANDILNIAGFEVQFYYLS